MSQEIEDVVKLTPMMEQWHRCKREAKEAILLFRMGDFYEAFYEDAKLVADKLELTLTRRQGIPMSGVPWHTCDTYIDRLVAKGYKVAIAEQTEDAKQAKGLVHRAVVRVVTPGTVINSSLLGDTTHNFIAALTQVGSIFGLAYCDITTACFKVLELDSEQELAQEIFRLAPSEVVMTKKFRDKHSNLLFELEHTSQTLLDEWRFEHQTAHHYLTSHFHVPHLDGFGLKGCLSAINAGGALLAYLHEELCLSIQHIQTIKPYSNHHRLILDRICLLNLEVTEPLQGKQKHSTLLSVIDHTLTPMGGRLIREWLKHPLLDIKEIQKRQDAIEAFCQKGENHNVLREELKAVRDLERLMMKVSTGFATPRDLLALGNSLEKMSSIKECVRTFGSELLFQASEQLRDLSEIVDELKRALVEEPPVRMTEGNIFREGYQVHLDELRSLMKGGREWLARYQIQIKEETGVKNLKVSFNKIFGYYIEVSKGQASLLPPSFERRQTLVNAERFVTPALREYENQVLTAEDQAFSLEQVLFQDLKSKMSAHASIIFSMAEALSVVDVLQALAFTAKKFRYCRPLVDESTLLHIQEGRHPVVEAAIEKNTFIPNDTQLTGSSEKMMVITGPNMAGKSTYIRQVALIVILAQMGSYVPATSAHMGVFDRIFTRIGASDDLSRGQSTFMVEMSETANILNNITPRSLVILDEIGRGTSTFDGISIAWAVADYLLATEAKTLFATHYGELTELEKLTSGCVNYHASVNEWNNEIVFLHKVIKGGADRSYGIHVARLAGLPLSVIQKANSVLQRLEARKETAKRTKKDPSESQLMLF